MHVIGSLAALAPAFSPTVYVARPRRFKKHQRRSTIRAVEKFGANLATRVSIAPRKQRQ